MTDRLLEAEDVAAMVGMSRDWIYAEVRADRIPHVRLGRCVRFRREAVDEWLRGAERGRMPSDMLKRPGAVGSRPGHGTGGRSSHADPA